MVKGGSAAAAAAAAVVGFVGIVDRVSASLLGIFARAPQFDRPAGVWGASVVGTRGASSVVGTRGASFVVGSRGAGGAVVGPAAASAAAAAAAAAADSKVIQHYYVADQRGPKSLPEELRSEVK
jgi:hypothetical protein